MATDKKRRIVWTEDEWFDVMRLAVPLRDKEHCGGVYAANQAQKKALPKDRQRTEIGLAASRQNGSLHEYEARFRSGWVPDARKEGAPPPAAPRVVVTRARHGELSQDERDKALQATFTGVRVFWTEREWAMMALAARHKIDNGDTRQLGRVLFETQADVLPLNRCRPIANFYRPDILRQHYEDALRLARTLPPEVQAKLTGREAEYAEHQAKTAAGLAATQTPIDPAPAAPEPVSEPSSPVAAPLPAMVAPAAGDPLAARIAAILADAGAKIAHETRAFVLGELDRQLDAIVAGVAAGMRGHVQQVLAAELGGPVQTPPAAPAAPTPAGGTPEDETPPPDVSSASAAPLRVDIISKGGSLPRDVRLRAEALGIEARFVHVNDANAKAYKPPHHVIVASDDLPRSAVDRIRESSRGLEFARGGQPTIIRLVEMLADYRGQLQ